MKVSWSSLSLYITRFSFFAQFLWQTWLPENTCCNTTISLYHGPISPFPTSTINTPIMCSNPIINYVCPSWYVIAFARPIYWHLRLHEVSDPYSQYLLPHFSKDRKRPAHYHTSSLLMEDESRSPSPVSMLHSSAPSRCMLRAETFPSMVLTNIRDLQNMHRNTLYNATREFNEWEAYSSKVRVNNFQGHKVSGVIPLRPCIELSRNPLYAASAYKAMSTWWNSYT